jgi:hypothetical protein
VTGRIRRGQNSGNERRVPRDPLRSPIFPPDQTGGGWLVRAIRGFAAALGLLALCCASGAKADAVSAGQRAFARHDYVRAASAGSCGSRRPMTHARRCVSLHNRPCIQYPVSVLSRPAHLPLGRGAQKFLPIVDAGARAGLPHSEIAILKAVGANANGGKRAGGNTIV